MLTVADYHAYLSAANAAMDASDWRTAKTKLAQAMSTAKGIPSGASGPHSMQLQSNLEPLIKIVDEELSRQSALAARDGSGWQRQSVEYVPEGCVDG